MTARQGGPRGSRVGAASTERVGFIVVAAIAAGLAIAELVMTISHDPSAVGLDYRFYRAVGARWLETGSFYLPRQLTGPYDIELMSDVVYPPFAVLLFAPLAYAPSILWWLIPIGALAFVLSSFRASVKGWAAIAVLLMWPRANAAFVFGNTDMWVATAVGAGLRWGWPAALVAIKPTMLPFVLVGVRHRSFVLGIAILAVASLATWRLWPEYVLAMQNLRVGLEYSIGSLPLMLVPLAAWLTRSRRDLRAGNRC
jgi:hypothetical protein